VNILSIPGMNDNVKIQLSVPRKNVLLLSKVIECGLGKEGTEDDNILNITPKETIEELITISSELLEKAGLTEMNQKLNMLK
jgi:hypothetical protein